MAYPNGDWHTWGDNFVANIWAYRAAIPPQIEHYDNLAAQFDAMKRINNIFIDFAAMFGRM